MNSPILTIPKKRFSVCGLTKEQKEAAEALAAYVNAKRGGTQTPDTPTKTGSIAEQMAEFANRRRENKGLSRQPMAPFVRQQN